MDHIDLRGKWPLAFLATTWPVGAETFGVRMATVILSTLTILPPVLYVAVVDAAAQMGRSAAKLNGS
jgi:hypothetical protein